MTPPVAIIGVRPAARGAWQRLHELLARVGPVPCTTDPDLWHSEDPGERELAVMACMECLALQRCGEFADANKESAGVWAGLDRTVPAGRPAQSVERSA